MTPPAQSPLSLDASQIVGHIQKLSQSLDLEVLSLESRWQTFDRVVIAAMAKTMSLGIMTALSGSAVYITISRNWRDKNTIAHLSYVLLEWLTTLVAWLIALSLGTQEYGMLDYTFRGVRDGLDAVADCVSESPSDCAENRASLAARIPLYVMHRCVGSGLVAAEAVLRCTVMCGVAWLLLRPKKDSKLVMGALLLGSLLATSKSAATNVHDTCWPPDLVLPSGLRLGRGWSITSSSIHPRLDDTTAKLVALTDVLTWTLIIRSTWLSSPSMASEDRRAWLRWVIRIYALPTCAYVVISVLYQRYTRSINRSTSFPVYAALTCVYEVIIPLLRVYPQLLHLRYKLADSAESRTDAQSTDSSATDAVSGRGAEEATNDQKKDELGREETSLDGEENTQSTHW